MYTAIYLVGLIYFGLCAAIQYIQLSHLQWQVGGMTKLKKELQSDNTKNVNLILNVRLG